MLTSCQAGKRKACGCFQLKANLTTFVVKPLSHGLGHGAAGWSSWPPPSPSVKPEQKEPRCRARLLINPGLHELVT